MEVILLRLNNKGMGQWSMRSILYLRLPLEVTVDNHK